MRGVGKWVGAWGGTYFLRTGSSTSSESWGPRGSAAFFEGCCCCFCFLAVVVLLRALGAVALATTAVFFFGTIREEVRGDGPARLCVVGVGSRGRE